MAQIQFQVGCFVSRSGFAALVMGFLSICSSISFCFVFCFAFIFSIWFSFILFLLTCIFMVKRYIMIYIREYKWINLVFNWF